MSKYEGSETSRTGAGGCWHTICRTAGNSWEYLHHHRAQVGQLFGDTVCPFSPVKKYLFNPRSRYI